MSQLLIGQFGLEKPESEIRHICPDVYMKNMTLWKNSKHGQLLLGELKRVVKVQSEEGYLAYLENDGAEDFVSFPKLGGNSTSEEGFTLLVQDTQNNPDKAYAFFVKNENDIYLSKKGHEPKFIGTFQLLERTDTGDVLMVQKGREELLYDLETGGLVYIPIDNETHWINSTGCVTRKFPWKWTGEICAEVYMRNQCGVYQCCGRIFA